jgi:ElaB/YqjD/DUF883 family membrane-anchored ribosome-binding protein
MPNNPTSFETPRSDRPTTIGGTLSDTAAQVKDKASDLGHTTVDAINEKRGAAASGLEKAASTLHNNAESLPGGDKVSGVAHAAADKLSATADYVRTHDVNKMMADVETLVKNNPGPSLVAAAAIGFLAGRAFRGND